MVGAFSAIQNKKLVIVTGKGGAGKSTLALALAHRLSGLGKKLWLVEIGRKRDQEFSRLPELVGKKLGHEPTQVLLPGNKTKTALSVLDPTQSLGEYIDLKLPTGGLARVVLNNRVTASFLEVVPGLPDLVALGKLWHALTRSDGKGVDLVILDAPATGHALSLLRAPANFQKITRVGPIHRDAAEMAAFLKDPTSTSIVLTGIPEEMAIKEIAETQTSLAKDFPTPLVFINKCFPSLPPLKAENPDSLLWRAYVYSEKRGAREKQATASLKGATLLPFLFPEAGSLAPYLRLSEELR